MMNRYKLDPEIGGGRVPIPVDDMMEWAQWFDTCDRVVARDEVGDLAVSTVFLAIDHQFGEGPPKLFETMVFGDDEEVSKRTRRSSTWEEAEHDHREVVAKLLKG